MLGFALCVDHCLIHCFSFSFSVLPAKRTFFFPHFTIKLIYCIDGVESGAKRRKKSMQKMREITKIVKRGLALRSDYETVMINWKGPSCVTTAWYTMMKDDCDVKNKTVNRFRRKEGEGRRLEYTKPQNWCRQSIKWSWPYNSFSWQCWWQSQNCNSNVEARTGAPSSYQVTPWPAGSVQLCRSSSIVGELRKSTRNIIWL